MARIGISYDQVADAAAGLVDEGQLPTIQAVRARLGTGSPNSIQRHLQAWREKNSRPQAQMEIGAPLAAAILDSQARAVREAREAANKTIAMLESDLQEMGRSQTMLESEIDAVRSSLETATTEREQLRGRLSAAEQTQERTEKVVDTLREALASAERARVQAETKASAAEAGVVEARHRIQTLESALLNHASQATGEPVSTSDIEKRKK